MTDLGYMAIVCLVVAPLSFTAGVIALFSDRWRRYAWLAFLSSALSAFSAWQWWFQVVP